MDFSAEGPSQAQRPLHLSPHGHQYHQQGSGSPVYHQYPHASMAPVDPTLGPTQGTARFLHASSSPHRPQQEGGTLNFYADASHSTVTPATPSQAASPNFNGAGYSFAPGDRSLPLREVDDETLADAYAAFILYCNPNFLRDHDTSELKRNFRKLPMSDNKTFDAWKLFELIARLERGEVKTWTQLALELGVEAPDLTKGQSSQKIQQYSVRLKRWMRAMHIDAFFEYLTGKMPRYCTQIPPPHEPFPKNGRDGVPLEEDLAIRALDPSYRPKRGRKKTDDIMGDDESTPPPKRPQLDTSFAFSTSTNPQSACPNSALPMSAHPDDFVNNDPWATATISTPSNLQRGLSPNSAMTAPGGAHIRWRLNTQDNPSSPHPLSAVSPMTGRPPDSAFDEPLSAITPSTSRPRARRRHGPAVSSAWPSSSGGSNGKLRGRPPANRSVRDGPYVTFPANPNTKEAPIIDLSRNTPGPTPVQERAQPGTSVSGEQQVFRFPPTPASAVSTASAQPPVPASSGPGRGQRLSLQVPRRESGPVHLVTPTVLVNGESDDSASQGNTTSLFDELTKAAGSTLPRITREDLRRALAAELLRAEISNRKRLRGSEAKALAHALLGRLQAQNQGASRSAVANSREEDEDIFGITCASWLGLGAPLGLGGNGIVGGTRKISVQRFRMSDDGYESPVDEEEDGASESSAGDGRKIKEVFDVSWSLLFGGCGGEFLVKGLIISSEGEGQDEEIRDARSEKSLEERVRGLEAELRAKEQEMQRLRETVLGAVM